jgi:hypothetical protein
VGNKRNRKPPVESVNLRAKMKEDLKASGFDPDSMTEFDLALLVQIGAAKNEITDAIDGIGGLIEEYLFPEEEES